MASNSPIGNLLVQIQIDLAKAQRQLNQLQNITGNATNRMQKQFARLGKIAAMFYLIRQAIRLVVGVMDSLVDASRRVEKAIVDVNVITQFDSSAFAENFETFARSMDGLDIAKISQLQQGIARLGLATTQAEFFEFSRAAAMLAATSGDINLNQAGSGLGKLIINFKLTTEEGLKVGNMLDVLSDKFPTTTGAILQSSTRLAGLAKSLNITVDQLAAMVTQLQSTGQSTTVVASTLSRVLPMIATESAKVGKALGFTGEKLEHFIRVSIKDVAAGYAILLKTLKSKDIIETQRILEVLKLTGLRIKPALLAAAEGAGTLGKASAVANESLGETNNILNKYKDLTITLDFKIKEMTKSWDFFKDSLLDTDAIKVAIDAITALLNALSGKTDFDELPLVGSLSRGELQAERKRLLKRAKEPNGPLTPNDQSGHTKDNIDIRLAIIKIELDKKIAAERRKQLDAAHKKTKHDKESEQLALKEIDDSKQEDRDIQEEMQFKSDQFVAEQKLAQLLEQLAAITKKKVEREKTLLERLNNREALKNSVFGILAPGGIGSTFSSLKKLDSTIKAFRLGGGQIDKSEVKNLMKAMFKEQSVSKFGFKGLDQKFEDAFTGALKESEELKLSKENLIMLKKIAKEGFDSLIIRKQMLNELKRVNTAVK